MIFFFFIDDDGLNVNCAHTEFILINCFWTHLTIIKKAQKILQIVYGVLCDLFCKLDCYTINCGKILNSECHEKAFDLNVCVCVS